MPTSHGTHAGKPQPEHTHKPRHEPPEPAPARPSRRPTAVRRLVLDTVRAARRLRLHQLAVLILLAGMTPAQASTIEVAPPTAADGTCSLREAIDTANAIAASGANPASGDCAAATSGTPAGQIEPNVIVLAAGNYVFSSPPDATTDPQYYWYGPDALPPIASNIKIVGNDGGSALVRSDAAGTPPFRFFYVGGGQSLLDYNAANLHGQDGFPDCSGQTPDPVACQLPGPGTLTLVALTLRNGLAKGGDSTYGGGGLGAGGAIYNQGTLILERVTLEGNTARGGSGGVRGTNAWEKAWGGGGMGADAPYSFSGSGFVAGGWPDATAAGGTFGNGGLGMIGGIDVPEAHGGVGGGGYGGGTAAGGYGGFGGGGSGGSSGGFGAGASNSSWEGGGGASMGGAVFNDGGIVLVTNSTLANNTAHGGDSGAASGCDALGGAVFNLNGTVTLRFSTLAHNHILAGHGDAGTGDAKGGAIYSLYLPIPGSPAADGGLDAEVTVHGSILAGSSDGQGQLLDDCRNNGGSWQSTGRNIVQTAGNCVFDANGDLPGSDPQLAATLAGNGGPTHTLLPATTSPAIDHGGQGCPLVDQRGVQRPQGPSCDIGAVEIADSTDDDIIFQDGFEAS